MSRVRPRTCFSLQSWQGMTLFIAGRGEGHDGQRSYGCRGDGDDLGHASGWGAGAGEFHDAQFEPEDRAGV